MPNFEIKIPEYSHPLLNSPLNKVITRLAVEKDQLLQERDLLRLQTDRDKSIKFEFKYAVKILKLQLKITRLENARPPSRTQQKRHRQEIGWN